MLSNEQYYNLATIIQQLPSKMQSVDLESITAGGTLSYCGVHVRCYKFHKVEFTREEIIIYWESISIRIPFLSIESIQVPAAYSVPLVIFMEGFWMVDTCFISTKSGAKANVYMALKDNGQRTFDVWYRMMALIAEYAKIKLTINVPEV